MLKTLMVKTYVYFFEYGHECVCVPACIYVCAVYICMYVCRNVCVGLLCPGMSHFQIEIKHMHTDREQQHILCTSKAMTNLAGPPRIKESYDNWNIERL